MTGPHDALAETIRAALLDVLEGNPDPKDARDALAALAASELDLEHQWKRRAYWRERAEAAEAALAASSPHDETLRAALTRIATFRHPGSFRVEHYDHLKQIARDALGDEA